MERCDAIDLVVLAGVFKFHKKNWAKNCILRAKAELANWPSEDISILCAIMVWEVMGLARRSQIWIVSN